VPPIKRPERPKRRTYFREWREAVHPPLSMNRAAKMAGYDHGTLQRLETGQIPYNQHHLEILAPIYGCQPHDLISRHPDAARAMRSDVFDMFQRAPPEIQKQVMATARALLRDIPLKN